MKEIRLIIIEEHPAVRDALHTRLGSLPHLEVVAAYQCTSDWVAQDARKDAIEADVVLLGLKSGRKRPLTDIVRDIKEFNQAGLAVVVLASLADDVEKELILQAGARRYLLKNINSNELISEIEALAPSKVH
jgi:DNA-binding NarL/FixJ family response regulator